MKTLDKFTLHLSNEGERVCNVLTFVAKLKIFGKSHVPNYSDILIELIQVNESLPPAASKNLADIAEVYKELQVIREMVALCDICFKK